MNPRRIILYLILVLPALTPLIAPYPPFQDWAAHAGLIGLAHHASDPATKVAEFYRFAGWLKLNSMMTIVGYAIAWVTGPFFAAQLMLGLSLGALGPAMARLCRAAGTHEAVALLVLPLALGRHVYCGFIPNALALALMLAALGAYVAAGQSGARRHIVEWCVWMVLLAWTHAFIFLAAAGLFWLIVFWDLLRRDRRAFLIGLAGLTAGAVTFAILYFGGVGYVRHAESSALEGLWASIKNPDPSPEIFWEWLFAHLRQTELDDYSQGLWLALIAVGVIATLWQKRRELRGSLHVQLIAIALFTTAVYQVLPVYVGAPFNWWGASLRLPPMIILFLIPLIGPAPRKLITPLLALAAALGITMISACWWDMKRWSDQQLDGFPEIVASIPKGKRLTLLYRGGWTPYPGVPLLYFTSYYMLNQGGIVPTGFTTRRESPFLDTPKVPKHGYGHTNRFKAAHFDLYDVFLVEKARDPFQRRWAQQVQLMEERGAWRLYRKR